MAKKIDPKAMGKRGGRTRAASLSADRRTEIAREGAVARWAKRDAQAGDRDHIPAVICGSEDRPLVIGEVRIPCFVLEDSQRVISLRGLQDALGLSTSGGAPRLASLMGSIDPNSANANDLAVRLASPVAFRIRPGGRPGNGYPATLLADICDAILAARAEGNLSEAQERMAERAEVLIRGWARVGIIAMVDEVTGYQDVRSRTALAEILSRFISDRIMPWTKRFPDEFYRELFRLKGWDFSALRPGDPKPSVVGRYTRNIVYQRMAPGVIEELERLNPRIEPGRRQARHHQWLTEDIGHPTLREHIAKVLTVMKLSDGWEDFKSKLRRALPKQWEQYTLADLFPNPPGEPPGEDGDDPD